MKEGLKKIINKINELKSLTIVFILDPYWSLKNIVCKAQTHPISKIRKELRPIKVNKKSETLAPRGPPKLFISKEDDLLKKAGSVGSYETSAIKIYKEKAIRKKLKKFNSVFLTYRDFIVKSYYVYI